MHSFALVKLYRRVQTFYKDVPHVGCSVGTTGPTSFPYGGRKRCTKPGLILLCQLGQGFLFVFAFLVHVVLCCQYSRALWSLNWPVQLTWVM